MICLCVARESLSKWLWLWLWQAREEDEETKNEARQFGRNLGFNLQGLGKREEIFSYGEVLASWRGNLVQELDGYGGEELDIAHQ